MTTITKCTTCGMPDLEGPLREVDGSLMCEECQNKQQVVCDFCLEPDPGWGYSCPEMVGVLLGPSSHSEIDFQSLWLACDSCKILIDGSEVKHLVDRAFAFRGIPEEIADDPEASEEFHDTIQAVFTVLLTVLGLPGREVREL